jgi:hypothetical protein
MKKNDDLGNFWKVVEYMASSNLLYEFGDYKLIITREATRRYFDAGLWKSEEFKFTEPTQLLYLTTSRVFSLYKAQCLREGDKPLPESTIEYYLKNSPAFVFETKKESFQKIDPKTGKQETTDAGEKKRTSTTALVFRYDKLNINIANETGDESNDPEVHEAVSPQAMLPFADGKSNDPDLPF